MALTLVSVERDISERYTDRRGYGIQYINLYTGPNAGKFICVGCGQGKFTDFSTITDLPIGSRIKDTTSGKEYVYNGATPWVEYVISSGGSQQFTATEVADLQEISAAWSDAPNDGATAATTALTNELITIGAINPAPTNSLFGKGGTLTLPTGIFKTGGLSVKSNTALEGKGARGSSMLVHDHTGVTAETATVTVLADGGQLDGMSIHTTIKNLSINGDKTSATHAFDVHGILVPAEGSTASQRSPIIEIIEVANCTGDGIRCLAGRDQLQTNNLKSLANKKWGLNLENVQDLKLITTSAGRNQGGQLRLNNCGTAKIIGFDIWTPGAGSFTGEYAVQVESCSWVHFIGGEIQGRVFVSGTNDLNNNANRFARRGVTFQDVHFKVSLETYQGVNYISGGGSLYTYLSQIVLQDIDHVKFINCTFGFGSGDTIAGSVDLYAARPDYFIEFRSSNSAQLAANCGSVIFNGMSLIHSGRPGTLQPMVPFKKHWTNLPSKIDWLTGQPGEYKYLPNTGTAPAGGVPTNFIGAGTTGLIASDYPLLYLGLDQTRLLSNVVVGTTTFDVPAGPGTAPTGMGKYYRYE